ncbi:MAG: DUF2007 domain-containing protein [Hyphomicrobiales bacterium]|nr:DUF2007 domain-containing protein [Hyphomicrobiales bacterium]MCY4032400.1 DUF2007 domain-containing protein [Hyphomicrobiales bacterium]MCY4038400.1 DUF2007 domain-containing protein [Hyphomicrobiales bacterium]
MIELLRSNDAVLLSYVQSLLDGDGIEYLLLDSHMSIMEGSLGILPRRLMVSEDDKNRARRLLENAGLGDHAARS